MQMQSFFSFLKEAESYEQNIQQYLRKLLKMLHHCLSVK